MEFIVNLFNWFSNFFAITVGFGQYVQTNIVILIIAVIVFAISTVILRSIFKILLFIPVLIFATIITIWVVNYITGANQTNEQLETTPSAQNFDT